MAQKQTPLTLENFGKLLDKRLGGGFNKFEKHFDKEINTRFDRFEKHFDQKINETKEELRAEINHLPTKQQYYKREDKTTVFR